MEQSRQNRKTQRTVNSDLLFAKIRPTKDLREKCGKDFSDELETLEIDVSEYRDIKCQERSIEGSVEESEEILCEAVEYEDIPNQPTDVYDGSFKSEEDHSAVDEDEQWDAFSEMDDIRKKSGSYEEIHCHDKPIEEHVRKMDVICKEAQSYNDISVPVDLKMDGPEIAKEKRGNLTSKEINLYEFALNILDEYDFRYLAPPDGSKLYKFNGMYWEPMSDEDIELIVYDEMDDKERAEQGNIKSFCKRVAEFIIFECKNRYKSGLQFTEEDFKAIENQIVFKNCVYDVQTGKKLPHDKALPYYFGIDVEYTKVDANTPMYDKLKRDATRGDADSMEMFDLMIGYLMVPNRSAKCYFILAFEKDSGKSILGHFIESMYMGMRVKTIDLEHLAGRFSLSNADTVVLLSGLETSMDKVTETVAAQIKRITGEKSIRMEMKYKSECDVPIRFKLLLATNGGMLLEKNIVDSAFYRRTIVIPFIQSTPLKDIIADMPEKLQEEKSAILSKAARRLKNIINFDGGIRFPESELSLEIKKVWIRATDYDEKFIKNELVYTGHPDDALPKDDIYNVYESYFKNTTRHIAGAIMCSKKDLMKKISGIYPGVIAKKLRRRCIEDTNDTKLRPCIAGLKWRE